ncbi:MAG: adenylyltransferase/cytidyltransferase family protein [Candidatus Omnitrophica bacterium]|nr:adenylyltransferase/cytidyltransferase family protein [Candidatus Omnitrophota bacterium]
MIAFTNGCFDILHVGHVTYLDEAKGKDRILIVGLNSDRSTRSIKGVQRPIVNQDERAVVLSALSVVDYITIFDEDTPERIISILKPDVLIKGADWKDKKVAGSESVESRGGKVIFISYLGGKSSTDIIDRIAKISGR